MKAYRINNDIVAALDEAAALRAFLDHYACSPSKIEVTEEVNPADIECTAEDERGGVDLKVRTVADVMPPDGPAEIICFGECEDCGAL